MNLAELIKTLVARMVSQDSTILARMAEKEGFKVSKLTDEEKEAIQAELISYLILCFVNLFRDLGIPMIKFNTNLTTNEIIDYSFLIGTFLTVYPEYSSHPDFDKISRMNSILH